MHFTSDIFHVSGTHPWRLQDLTLREALRMPLPEPDPPPEGPQPECSFEAKSAAYRTSPAGGVVTWEMAPDGKEGLIDTIKHFADTAEDTERR